MQTTTQQSLVVQTRDLKKTYQMGGEQVHALNGVNLEIKSSEVIAIMGPSGSGKSTLMNILGCLDRPTSGDYTLDGLEISKVKDKQLAHIRNRKVGFVFQSFNLLTRHSALENVMLPMRYGGFSKGVRDEAKSALEMVGLGNRVNHRPTELSGGKQQRVAIARAIINRPAILMADEPTGALDSKSGREIMELLLKMNEDRGTTLILVTHDPSIAEYAQRTIHIRDGQIVKEVVQ